MTWLSKVFGGSKKQPTQKGGEASVDQATLGQLAHAGADLAKATDVVNYLYLPDEARAQEASVALRSAGFMVEVRPAATGPSWLARANKVMIPTAANIHEMRALFEGLAARLGGEYDGWEAAVTT